jgi:Bcr/CflA subfamily drug resistance transporter
MKIKLNTLIFFIVLLGLPQISGMLITPSYENMAHDLNTTSHMTEFSFSIFCLGFSLGVSFWGNIADQRGRRPAMLMGLFFFVLGSLGCMFSHSIYSLLAATCIQAFGASVGSVITQTMLRDVCEEKERTQVFNIVGMSLAFSPAIGSFLGNYINQYSSWRYGYGFIFFLTIGILAYSYARLQETLPSNIHKRTFRDYKIVAKMMIRDPFIWICSCLIAICNVNIFGFFAEGPYIFVNNLNISEDVYAWLGIVISSAIFFGGFLNKRLIHKYSSIALVVLGMGLMFLGSIVFLGVSSYIYMYKMQGFVPMMALMIPLFVTFLGDRLVISTILSIGLRNYTQYLGTAGSVFGFSYYILLSGLTGALSWAHNGTILPLPIMIFICSGIGYFLAKQMSRAEKTAQLQNA